MTDQEHKLIENLTKQLELSNKIALKQIQEQSEPSVNDARLIEAEIGLMYEKEKLFISLNKFITIISIITSVIATIGCIAIIVSLGACASAF